MLVGLCVAGVVAVAYDQLSARPLAMQPQTVSASAVPSSPPRTPAAAAEPSPVLDHQASVIAQRLRQVSGKAPSGEPASRDIFQPGDAWVTRAKPVPVAENLDQVTSEQFLQHHQLRAIMVSGNVRKAVIDSAVLKVGDTWDRFQVTAITDRSAVLTCSGTTVTLELPK